LSAPPVMVKNKKLVTSINHLWIQQQLQPAE